MAGLIRVTSSPGSAEDDGLIGNEAAYKSGGEGSNHIARRLPREAGIVRASLDVSRLSRCSSLEPRQPRQKPRSTADVIAILPRRPGIVSDVLRRAPIATIPTTARARHSLNREANAALKKGTLRRRGRLSTNTNFRETHTRAEALPIALPGHELITKI